MLGRLQLPTRLLMADATAAWAQLSTSLKAEVAQVKNAAGQQVQISAAPLTEFDSAALSVLLSAARLCRELGVELRLLDPQPKLRELAGVYGVADLLWPAAVAEGAA
jgi:phospholipid transport system transporter-binding protein